MRMFKPCTLRRMKHPHPMVYLKGVDSNLVMALMSFLYEGEASIFKEELDDFLGAADDLKLLGLTGEPEDPLVKTSNEKYTEKSMSNGEKKAKQYKTHKKEVAFDMRVPKTEEGCLDRVGDPPSLNSLFSPSKAAAVEEKLMSMMERLRERSEFKWMCKVCDRRTKGSKDNMRRHVEKHIDGLSYPCLQCGKVSKSSSGLKMHMVNYHRSEHI